MEDLSKFPVCKHITADSKVPERLQLMRSLRMAEGKIQWKPSRVTVTGKVTAVSSQSP